MKIIKMICNQSGLFWRLILAQSYQVYGRLIIMVSSLRDPGLHVQLFNILNQQHEVEKWLTSLLSTCHQKLMLLTVIGSSFKSWKNASSEV